MSSPQFLLLPFRPVSLDDFARYAKSLSYVIEEPLQPAQRLLAQAYGYKDLHALQQVMKAPGESGVFDDAIRQGRVTVADGYDYHDYLKASHGRQRRLLELVASIKGVPQLDDLPKRWAHAGSIGLFDSPSSHRSMFQQVRAMLDVLDGKEAKTRPDASARHAAATPGRVIADYVVMQQDEHGGAIPYLTEKGRAVRAALEEVFPEHAEERDPMAEYELVQAIQKKHPVFPWPYAWLVTEHAELGYIGGWADIWPWGPGGKDALDVEQGFKTAAKANANTLLPFAERAIHDMQFLYKGVTRFANYKTQLFNYDPFIWPALLYWGGRVAMSAGEPDKAIRWLKECLRVEGRGHDGFSARIPLSALYLATGRGEVRKMYVGCGAFDQQSADGWMFLSVAAEYAGKGDYPAAAKHFAQAAMCAWAVPEMFNPRWRDGRSLRIISNHHLPAYLQEFMHISKPFWARQKLAHAFFVKLSSDPEILQCVYNYHRNMSLGGEDADGITAAAQRLAAAFTA